MTTASTRALLLVLLLAACLALASCGGDEPPQSPSDIGPVFDAPSSALGEAGEDINFGFTVWDPNGQAVDSVWATGAYDSVLFSPTTGVGQLFWRACQPGTYTASMWAMSGTPPLTTMTWVRFYVSGGFATHYINMIGGHQHFDPETLIVANGETVAFRNVDTAPHDANTGSYYRDIATGVVKPGCVSRAYNLEPARSYNYFCDSDTGRFTPCVIIVNP